VLLKTKASVVTVSNLAFSNLHLQELSTYDFESFADSRGKEVILLYSSPKKRVTAKELASETEVMHMLMNLSIKCNN
jgi:hypothetical protein